MAESGTMHIGELAEKTGLSLRTIRHYDEVGVLKPSGRTEGGFRLYTDHDMSRLLLIRRMKPLGFTLEEMSDLLATIAELSADPPGDGIPAAKESLRHFIEETEVRRARLEKQLDAADEFLELLRSH